MNNQHDFDAFKFEGEAPIEQDPQLMRISEALDRLAAEDRNAAPAGLEDRIFLRTRTSLTNPNSRDDLAPVVRKIGWATPMRLAACIAIGALVIGLSLTLVSRLGTSSHNPVPQVAGISESEVQLAEEALDRTLDATLAWNGELGDEFTDLMSDLSDYESVSSSALDDFWWTSDEESM